MFKIQTLGGTGVPSGSTSAFIDRLVSKGTNLFKVISICYNRRGKQIPGG